MIKIDTRSFKRSAAKLMDLRNWPDARAFWMAQGKGAMKEVIANMPPSEGKANLDGKRRGEAAVEGDIRKLFQGVAPSRAEAINIAAVHRQARNSRGRVAKALQDPHSVRRAALNQYIREKKSHVGYLAAGFNSAAAKVGYRPPAWIWRHNAPGRAEIRVTSSGIRIRAANRVPFASNITSIKHRVEIGLAVQERKIKRQVDYLLQKQAARAGFKSRR